MKKSRILGFALVFTVVGLILGLTLSSNLGIQSNGFTADTSVSKEAVDTLSRVSDALVEVVKAVRPSVVNISTTQIIHRRTGGGPFFNDPFFRRFFGDEFLKQFEHPREERRSSLGSGVIVTEDGYILTNNHVIKDADEIDVTLPDESEYKGKVVGTDPKTDLAVIKIEAKGLPAVRWGDSEALKVGEMIVAVGSPYGLNQTVTSGIVSAKGRANVRIADYEDFIQTDAAINPGNSGGPLINIRGELVGINTAIFSTTGGYQGIGFSIPSNMARSVMDSLINEGKVIRGWLGVTIQPLNKELAKQFNLKAEHGALVSDVVEDSPAEEAGIKRGDLIIEYAGKAVDDPLALRNAVAATHPGEKAEVKVLREGEEKTLTVKIGELPAEQRGLAGAFDNALAGVSVQDLTPELRQSLDISKRVRGVVVTDAPEGVGLQRGDVIMEVNRQPVKNAADYNKMVSEIKSGQDILLLVYRDGGVFYMTLKGGQGE